MSYDENAFFLETIIVDGDIIQQVGNPEFRRIKDLVAHVHKKRVDESIRIFAVRKGGEHFFELKHSESQ